MKLTVLMGLGIHEPYGVDWGLIGSKGLLDSCGEVTEFIGLKRANWASGELVELIGFIELIEGLLGSIGLHEVH